MKIKKRWRGIRLLVRAINLGAFPAQLIVKRFSDIEVKANPSSPYDYSNMYHGAL